MHLAMFDSFRIIFSWDISGGVILIIFTATASLPKTGLTYTCLPYRVEVHGKDIQAQDKQYRHASVIFLWNVHGYTLLELEALQSA